jgi:hypothetical protein
MRGRAHVDRSCRYVALTGRSRVAEDFEYAGWAGCFAIAGFCGRLNSEH